ncbi:MAG: hypothetical protein QW794_08785 [Thermosphaera sp.]
MSYDIITLHLSRIEELLRKASTDAVGRRKYMEEARRELERAEREFNSFLSKMMPERITDERFSIAVEAVNNVSLSFSQLRRELVRGVPTRALATLLKLEEALSRARSTLILLGAGAPFPLIFQVTPEFLRGPVRPPEEIQLLGGMVAQIYGILTRRGRMRVEELARELNITQETREAFNTAITELLQRRYARISVDERGNLYLEPL